MPDRPAAPQVSRRRLSFGRYLKRRWRVVGAVLVLLFGALLVLGVTDRGHDPVWHTRVAEIDQMALANDGSVAYALVRDGDNLSALEAIRGETGEVLWTGPLHAPRALLAAGDNGVAVATDFPLAFLTVYNPDGSPRWQVPLEGNPVALAMEGERIALALTAPGNPVLFFDGDLLIRTYRHPSAVRALDLEAGLVAAGGIQGEVIVWQDRAQRVNVTLATAVRSLRLSQDGTALIVGGAARTPTDSGGLVAFFDVDALTPPQAALRWVESTPVNVGLVDIDALGLRAVAVEEAPPEATLHVYDGATGATRWTRRVPGSIARADSGGAGGVAMSPDGLGVAVAKLRGPLQLLDASDGSEIWAYRTGGSNAVTFADQEPRRLLASVGLLENRPFDTLLLFSTAGEPIGQRSPILAAAIAAVAVATLAGILGFGYWRVRRPY